MPMLGFAEARQPDPMPREPEPSEQEFVEETSVRDEASDVVLTLLPWGISVLFHAAVVVLAVFLIWAVIEQTTEEEVVIPDMRLTDNPGSQLTTEQMEQVTQSSSTRSVTRRPTTNPSQSLTPTTVNLKTSLIGVKGASGGSASPFGTSIGDGTGFNANFFGNTGGNARSIVFVVDASGSMVDLFPFVIKELKKSINNLSEKQTFSVIFFSGGGHISRPPSAGLAPATPEYKRRVLTWLDENEASFFSFEGRPDPVAAVRQAVAMRPMLVYLLSDNITGGGTGATQYEINQDDLLRGLDRVNPKPVKINTIQFVYPDPLEDIPGMKGSLEQVADSTGGKYRFVDARELNIH